MEQRPLMRRLVLLASRLVGVAVFASAVAPASGAAQVAVDDVSAAQSGTSTTASLSWSHAAASNSVVFIGVAMRTPAGSGTEQVERVTYGGQDATFVAAVFEPDRFRVRQEVWMIVAPPGGSQPIEVVTNAVVRMVGSAISLAGADLSNPLGSPATAAGSDAPASVRVHDVGPGNLVVDFLARRHSVSPTPDPTQTEYVNLGTTHSSSGNNVTAGVSGKAASGSTDMRWELNGSSPWALIGLAVRSGTPTATPLAVHYFFGGTGDDNPVLGDGAAYMGPGNGYAVRNDGDVAAATRVAVPVLVGAEPFTLTNLIVGLGGTPNAERGWNFGACVTRESSNACGAAGTFCSTGSAPGSGVLCSIGASDLSCTDTSGSLEVCNGDRLMVKGTKIGDLEPAASRVKWSFQLIRTD